MKKTKKMLLLAYVGAMILLPKIALAGLDVDWGFGISVGSGGNGGMNGGGLSNNSYGLPGGSVFGIVEGILYWLLGILSVVAVIGFIISGIMYLTAAGDETQAGKAKKAMMYSIIGVIVGLSGFVIFKAAQYMLSGESF
ncbi:MAG: hypothetical protein US30_C0012G0008 [Candidatus Moranbacteria bacterium GW2011_GWF2_36_839]|nr:MAG: hypothetical protein US27_C0015G0019 [Candidatus Moranbacteria bacterium GW2011_GWF1_36_78]KKQ16698.1 MAG: hypothetical protein US30_C0012G0008 [Candidatus Moranbacteria bacterium GW2011_GWF2_36_839]HAT74211.1 hypothetical protein [Candidatus Moranbacteria bacterium]HBY11421.1 hypothetical protein [Candidatus Moranbacteria bacterium]